ncbi:MAG: hypothetical protein E4G95_09600 [Bacteroidia bacterium]|nr:MAG: hypothetical protein E4G95_09600 [Bacteroidia bacterium]
MKKLIFAFIILVMSVNQLKSQNPEKSEISKNIMYLEFGTNIIVSSFNFNYERHFLTSKSENLHLYGRAGFGAAAIYWGHVGFGGLLAATMITGKGNHYFEASGGLFLGYETPPPAGGSGTYFPVPLLDFGYRYQKPGKGFLFRAKAGILGIGVGLGYAF